MIQKIVASIILILALCGVPFTLFAQGVKCTISGKVIDQQNSPVAYASVAMRVRLLLPPHVDLYYMQKAYKGIKDKNGYVKTHARIVPDIRDIDERSRNRMKYKLY